MTLRVEVFLNNRQIASAQVSNLSDLADVSDYSASWRTEASFYNREGYGSINVCGHPRRQTPWALVARVADAITKRETVSG